MSQISDLIIALHDRISVMEAELSRLRTQMQPDVILRSAGTALPTLIVPTPGTALLSGGVNATSDITSGTLSSARLPHGTSFPASPATYDRFFRDDLGVECYYDGTRWLGPSQERTFTLYGSLMPITDTVAAMMASMYGTIYTEYVDVVTHIATTNNTSNYWNIQYYRDTTLHSTLSTQSFAPNTVLHTRLTIASGFTHTYSQYFYAAKVGSPGGLSAHASVRIRHVYT